MHITVSPFFLHYSNILTVNYSLVGTHTEGRFYYSLVGTHTEGRFYYSLVGTHSEGRFYYSLVGTHSEGRFPSLSLSDPSALLATCPPSHTESHGKPVMTSK